jgi:thymidylate synthase ThyX
MGNAFAQESTRYCNYLNKENCVFVEPAWWDEMPEHCQKQFEDFCNISEAQYFHALEKWNWSPQQARTFLNNGLKTELIITAYDFDWHHFFHLRCAEAAHPEARYVAEIAKSLLDKKYPDWDRNAVLPLGA